MPPTRAKPPPLSCMSVGQPGSIREMARRGFTLPREMFAPTAPTVERCNTNKDEVEAQGRVFDAADVGVCRAFYVAKDAADKQKAVEARLANQQRMAKLADPAGTGKSSMRSFDHTLDAAAESALFGTPDEVATKLEGLQGAGVTQVLLNGPAGSRENLRRFAREVMPAFSEEKRAAAE